MLMLYAVCGLVDEQENRCSRIAEPPVCTTCIDAPVGYIYATLGAFLGYICSSIKKLDFVSDCNVTDVEACSHSDYCADSVQPCSLYYESELCDVRPRSHVVSRNVPEPNAVLRGNMGPLYCEYSEVDEVDEVDEDCEDDDVGEGVPDTSPIDRDLGPLDTSLTVASSVKYDRTPEFGNLGCFGDLHTRKVDLVSNNPKGPTNPSVGRTRSDNKPPDIKQILDYPDCLNYINGRPDPISNESKSPTNPSLGRTRSDNKPPDIEIILDDPESLNYINGRPDPISNESKSPTNPSLWRTRSDNKPPDIEIILDDPESLNYINGRSASISHESKSLPNPSLGRGRSDNKPPD